MSVQRPKLHKGPLAECQVCNLGLIGIDECFRLITPAGKKRQREDLRRAMESEEQDVG